ncbi:MAG: hypothetical protein OXE98_07810 [Hyphomicrobiales bacterium]|nr:hypothetical protein [Hyphomicrobiales bacterium]
MQNTIKIHQFIEFSLSQVREKIGEILGGEVISICGSIDQGLDNMIYRDIEALKKQKGELSERLVVMIATSGGFVDVVERICNIFRHNFEVVDFIVPNCAYSAGTVLVLSGDNIYMDYHSVLGPIDPHIRDNKGRWIPGARYLHQYDKLTGKSGEGNLTDAELSSLAEDVDPADIFAVKQATERSKELIKKWLVDYKFKNWTTTATKKQNVTLEMKKRRAESIVEILGNTSRWHSRGYGITMRELRDGDIHLAINDYGERKELGESIRRYGSLLDSHHYKRNAQCALHSANGFTRLT